MEKDYSGMALNERLFVAKLLDVFDEAVGKRDRKRLVEILEKVNLNEHEANRIIDGIFTNPKKYGYK
jgi:hypothetical protein